MTVITIRFEKLDRWKFIKALGSLAWLALTTDLKSINTDYTVD